ncbi:MULTISPECIES: NlpC/P60 family protein [Chryseobacterium]|uniref:Outer membrane lipoprotein n=1 Tax=Chryseobacterium taihuense TaxID=1141221 RepID=A0A4U8W7X3_9FLAO|nr:MULTISPECIES: NlpC/P60 family protein [Chryseobacterium]QQV01216.1 C40 family peptidase [Chryseobacterium sp. FDAARGOS 1104]VFB02192.1 outer membrane lipoprotein [Chryseobacterium taihuense]
MKFNKLFYIVLPFIFCVIVFSCAGKKYIREIPYNYSSDSFSQIVQNQKENSDLNYSLIDDNPDGLNDDILRIKEKYSIILEVMPKEIKDYKLYSYLDEWIGTPYKKQMLEKQVGVEASYFVQALYSDIYKETFPKTPDGIFRYKSIQLFTGRTFLKEGDIVFFRCDKFRPISDVGIYLHNDRILACTAQGLNIYDFNDEYFQLRYVAAGRLKEKQ